MINYTDERIKSINQKIAELKVKECILPPDKWDRTYLQLKGIKGFWNELGWNEILIECPELSWITEIRSDETFRSFYKLKTDLDELIGLKGS
jgi:hypothetical protein